VSDPLDAVLDVVGDLDGVVVFESGQAFWDDLVRHGGAEGGHVALHDAGYGIARWTLKGSGVFTNFVDDSSARLIQWKCASYFIVIISKKGPFYLVLNMLVS